MGATVIHVILRSFARDIDTSESMMTDDFTGLLKFSAEWCQPCKSFAPVLSAVEQETGVEVRHVDIDTLPEIAAQFGVRSVPTTIALKGGQPVDMVVGAVAKEKVLAMVSKLNNNNTD